MNSIDGPESSASAANSTTIAELEIRGTMTTTELIRPALLPMVADRCRVSPTVAVIDDKTDIRTGLPGLLSGLTFVDAYEDVESLLAAAPAVDVVLLDLRLQGTGRVGLREGPDAAVVTPKFADFWPRQG